MGFPHGARSVSKAPSSKSAALISFQAQCLADGEEPGVEVSAECREAQVCSCREMPILERAIAGCPAEMHLSSCASAT